MHQQLRLVDAQHLEQAQVGAQVALLRQLGHAQLQLVVDGRPPLLHAGGGLLGVARTLRLLLKLVAQVVVVARHALDLPVAPLGQLPRPDIRQGGQGAQHLLARQRVPRRHARPPRFRQRLRRVAHQPRGIEQRLQMADFPAVVQVDGHGQDGLFLLVADELGLEPVHRLGEVHRADALDVQLQRLGQRQRFAQPAEEVVRVEVHTAEIEVGRPAAAQGVVEELVDQRRAVAGELGAGVLRQGLGVERQAQHSSRCGRRGRVGGQEDVVDLRLDLVPGAAYGFQVVAQEGFQGRHGPIGVARVHDGCLPSRQGLLGRDRDLAGAGADITQVLQFPSSAVEEEREPTVLLDLAVFEVASGQHDTP
jgi:hypothetical protein